MATRPTALNPPSEGRVLVMQRAATQLWAGAASFWHPGGLAWQARGIRSADSAVAVFGTLDAPTGWGWVEGGSHLNALAGAADTRTADAIAAWFVGEASADGALTASVPAASHALAAVLEAAGFASAPGAPFTVDMRLSTSAGNLGAVDLPGYRIRALQDGEQAQLVACHREAWNPHRLPFPSAHRPDLPADAASSFSEEAFTALEATWPFRRDLVTVVEASDGSFVGSCIAWLDKSTGVAEIEPLGVVPEHRGEGLGRALTTGAVAAVAGAGGSEVTIHPRGDDGYPAARRLYASCGFQPVGTTLELHRPQN